MAHIWLLPNPESLRLAPLITRALERNFNLLSAAPPPLAHLLFLLPHQRQHPRQRLSPYPSAPSPLPHRHAPTRRAARATRPPRRLRRALHQPRGLGRAHASWNAFACPSVRDPARYPMLPDYLDVPDGMSHDAPALAHCWPSAEEFLARAASSLDMQLPRDEQAGTQAIDMSVLVGAETLIGVGFSSLASNVVSRIPVGSGT
ncbi:hypothetical protein C8J57DRAFT_1581596 [Mycena rebaudengoi]|nr:hypothetical protein C8J57DRAFT_1581596 [Mycena rebaudengoi]